MKVYPIGYRSDGQYIAALMAEDPKLLLIDTRKVPYSKIEAFAQFTKAALQATYGKRYRAAGDYLGNLNYKNRNAGIVLAQPEIGIPGLIRYLNEGHDLILLCGCAHYAACHRKVIVEMLQAKVPGIDVVHTYRLHPIV